MISLFGKKKTETAREKQIKEFREAHPTNRKPYDNDGTYELLFQTPDKQYHILKIFLPGDFPSTKPG